jgi:GTP cyclohydrolase II
MRACGGRRRRIDRRPCARFARCVQEQGLDTVDANRALGLPDDCREYTSVVNILQDLGVKSIRLMVGRAPLNPKP